MPKPKINPIDIKTIAKEIEQIIGDFDTKPEAKSIGQIISVGDGVATIAGINDVALGEIIDLPQKTKALAFNLDNNSVGAVILGEYRHLKEGDEATTTGQVLAIPVDESLIGRIVNPLGDPLDGKRPIETKNLQLLEKS